MAVDEPAFDRPVQPQALGAGDPFLPKAVLYWNPTSVWSTVPRLALCEKGYDDRAFDLVEVDISKGDNFRFYHAYSPEYLKINPHGTIPTLVVPVLETVGRQPRFKSFQDTISILTFLDSSRTSVTSEHGSSSAPILSPATIEGKHLSDTLTLAVHLPSADPNFLLLCARTPHELVTKERGFAGEWVRLRQEALVRFRDQAEEDSPTRRFLEKKLVVNSVVYDVYYSPQTSIETEDRRKAFFAASKKAWEVGVVDVLTTLEHEMIGPLALGDEVSLADLHIIAWLSRVVFLSQGTATASGLRAVEDQIAGSGIGLGVSGGAEDASHADAPAAGAGSNNSNDDGNAASASADHEREESRRPFRIGKKTRRFWEHWIERESFLRVYVKN